MLWGKCAGDKGSLPSELFEELWEGGTVDCEAKKKHANYANSLGQAASSRERAYPEERTQSAYFFFSSVCCALCKLSKVAVSLGPPGA
jgi:hypothetical protein